jgi:F-type H+-transporting ATPase subunit b
MITLAAGGEINPLIPHTAEIIVGLVAFTLLFLVLRA